MVSFVGAGPGAEDLITVRGAKLLENTDVIIYAGSLVSESLLGYAKPECQIYNSAKMNLDEVIEVMAKADNAGLNVVRLHTGDPSVYGAIREQMDRLDELQIDYEVVPGVSSFCGAAAALKAEYTLPDVSQSVIITRMEGRTKVPELERISEFARHRATMVIFLSASMTDLLAKELIAGGYEEDTPAAIVYKASWPEEKVIRCTIGTLNRCAKENNITNHALITVGYFLGKDYELSKLYDSGFSTGLREAKTEETLKVSLIAFSEKGYAQAEKIADILATVNDAVKDIKIEITDICRCKEGGLNNWSAKHFRQDDALIYVGACGIATRAIAPYITHKTVDPAVIVVDEFGKNVIPLLSGHIGGANKLSEVIADRLGANAGITTATDINGVWAVDTWAVEKGMTIKNPEFIKVVSGKALRGETIKIFCDTEGSLLDKNGATDIVLEDLPDYIELCDEAKNADVIITYKDINENRLTLIPKMLCVGIGCKKDTSEADIRVLFDEVFDSNNLSKAAVNKICSIDLKAKEPGLVEFAQALGVELETFTADELNSLSGSYLTSEFVKSVAGVDSVCERSAVMGSAVVGSAVMGSAVNEMLHRKDVSNSDDSRLIVRKTAKNGVTIAVAVKGSI